jgi:ribosomal protein S18 acetylase RimI-like enzyme
VSEPLTVVDDPSAEDTSFLNDGLYQFNAKVTGVGDGRLLAVLSRDGAGQIQAGLHGWTWGGTGFVQALWVREDLRRCGLGSRLLRAAEQEAVRRGCHEMQLDSHSYQAPGFYRRLGYEAIGELPGWPGDTTRIFFRKALSA